MESTTNQIESKARDTFLLVFLPGLLFLASTILYYRQIFYPGIYTSDISSHIRFAQTGGDYSLLYFLMGKIVAASGDQYPNTVAVFNAILTVSPFYMLIWALRHKTMTGKRQSIIISMGALILSSIYLPVLQPFFYRYGIVTQPWHNITYTGMRCFATLCFCGFIDPVEHYPDRFSAKDWMCIAIPLALATAIKPSFLLAFSWTLLIFLIYDFLKNRNRKQIKQCILMGTTVFPALIVLYLQSRVLYGNPESGIELTFLNSPFFSGGIAHTVLMLMRGLLLPIIVFSFHRNSITRIEKFCIIQYLIALLQDIIFQETGPRASAGNFDWTLYIAGFFLFVVTFSRIGQDIERLIKNNDGETGKGFLVYMRISCCLAVFHIASGIAYFAMVFMRGNYYI